MLFKPNFSRPFEVHTDASKIAIGAVLIQRADDNIPCPMMYFSRKMKEAETRYSAIDAEALAVVEAVRTFDPYLYGRHFTIYTDHQPLTYAFSRRTKSPRMSRWAHELTFYDYDIKYKLGAHDYVPDLLSRAAADNEDSPQPEDMDVMPAKGFMPAENVKHAEDVMPAEDGMPMPPGDSSGNATPLDTQDVRRAQREDPTWSPLYDFLAERAPPPQRTPLPLDDFEMRVAL